jgi:hypothetical protein
MFVYHFSCDGWMYFLDLRTVRMIRFAPQENSVPPHHHVEVRLADGETLELDLPAETTHDLIYHWQHAINGTGVPG